MGEYRLFWESRKTAGENRRQVQRIMGEHRAFEETTEDEGGHQTVGKHGGLWESREDYRKEEAFCENTGLWENLEDYGRKQDCGGEVALQESIRNCERAGGLWKSKRIMGQHGGLLAGSILRKHEKL